LNSLRAASGWTQREAAAKAGFSDRLIRKAEHGRAIDAHSIAVLAQLYSTPERGLTVQDLLAEPLEPSSADRPAPSAAGVQPTSPIEELVLRWFEELWNQRRLKVIDELAAPNIVWHVEGRQFRGRRSVRRWVAELHAAFSDFEMVIDQLTVRDDLAICRWRLAMTHTGPWLGFAATGKRLVAHGSTWIRIEGGLIREGWDHWGQQHLSDAVRGGKTRH
jgi:steroid delta-isomerase-like uncharacterized protein